MRRFALVAVAALVLAVPTAASTPRITVFAASSLTEVFPRIDPKPRYEFAGSDQLALQIEQGAPADVFASASPKYAEELRRKGLVERPLTFASNRLVLIVPRSNPAHLRRVAEVARPGVRLVLAAASVPVGKYARQVLARLGLDRALENVVSQEPDVKSVVAKVALGEADAGFVYVTDVKPVASRVRTIAIPVRARPVALYAIAVVTSSRHLADARAFVARVLSPAGQRALRAAGFLRP